MGSGFSNRAVIMNEIRIYEEKQRLAELKAIEEEGNQDSQFAGLTNAQYVRLIAGLVLVYCISSITAFIFLT